MCRHPEHWGRPSPRLGELGGSVAGRGICCFVFWLRWKLTPCAVRTPRCEGRVARPLEVDDAQGRVGSMSKRTKKRTIRRSSVPDSAAAAAESSVRMRSEREVFADLAALCTSPGYVHALAFLAFRDNYIHYLRRTQGRRHDALVLASANSCELKWLPS